MSGERRLPYDGALEFAFMSYVMYEVEDFMRPHCTGKSYQVKLQGKNYMADR